MTHAFATAALAILLTGTAMAQQKPSKRTKSSNTTMSANDAARSNTSAANTHDGTNGASTGTGLTNDQLQGQSAGSSTNQTTKVDASSSIRTGASPVKARKKTPKADN